MSPPFLIALIVTAFGPIPAADHPQADACNLQQVACNGAPNAFNIKGSV